MGVYPTWYSPPTRTGSAAESDTTPVPRLLSALSPASNPAPGHPAGDPSTSLRSSCQSSKPRSPWGAESGVLTGRPRVAAERTPRWIAFPRSTRRARNRPCPPGTHATPPGGAVESSQESHRLADRPSHPLPPDRHSLICTRRRPRGRLPTQASHFAAGPVTHRHMGMAAGTAVQAKPSHSQPGSVTVTEVRSR